MARVLLVGSSGGHLAQMAAMERWWRDHERWWATFRTPDAESLLADEANVVWVHHPTTRSAKNAVRNLWLAVGMLRRVRPDVVVSTGAAVAVPFFLVARILRIPTVFVEVYDRLDSATLTGRLCRPLSSLSCVQWEEQLRLYPGARVIGPLL
jgi:UDP-N-acetylglucosamine:LPS N-acetylglucosamine transferase